MADIKDKKDGRDEGKVGVAAMMRTPVADHMLRLIPLGAGHSRAPSGGLGAIFYPLRFTMISKDSQAFTEFHMVSQHFLKKYEKRDA
ncbi:MAG TPA: hypothetical protein VG347_14175 [Verrucomicrobiae bacterium]|nr:hypothetical protein [Verrucomicrobiae bacterium]